MKKHFYSHIISMESLLIALEEMDFSDEQKAHLLSLIDSTIHHTVLDAILSELSKEDKKIFLMYLANDDHRNVWKHLNSKIDNIEEKIKKVVEDLKRELHKDIVDSKKRNTH